MNLFVRSCVVAAALTASLGVRAQEHSRFYDPNLLARLSFDNSTALETQGSQHICIAVSKDGSYRMVRRLVRLVGAYSMLRLEGTLPEEQLQQLQKLVGSSDLRFLPGNHTGLIRQSAESFAAEIPILGKQVGDGTLHVQWLNADGESPFPPPVSRILDWLNHFQPGSAKLLADLEFQDVCPSVGFKLLQPSVAANAR